MELMNGDLQSLMHENMHKDKTFDAPFSLHEAMDIMLQIVESYVTYIKTKWFTETSNQ
jgi:hypothetical protein